MIDLNWSGRTHSHTHGVLEPEPSPVVETPSVHSNLQLSQKSLYFVLSLVSNVVYNGLSQFKALKAQSTEQVLSSFLLPETELLPSFYSILYFNRYLRL